MREPRDVFHLAIPVHDLEAAQDFYVRQLGCKLSRRYDDRITIDFFGDQLVCHLTQPDEKQQGDLALYPRHFGVTFREAGDFEAVHHLCTQRHLPLFCEVGSRFEGLVEEHLTFVLRDPSDNLIEFKHYADHRMMY